MIKEVFIQVRIKEQTEVGEYNTCLYIIPQPGAVIDDVISSNEKEIDAEARKRIDDHVFSIKNAPEVVLTKEQLQTYKEEVQAQIFDIDARIQEIDNRII